MERERVMGLHANYIKAIETRLRWLRWAGAGGRQTWVEMGYAPAIGAYEDILESSETFYMNPRFGDLVDAARREIPDDIAFDARWMLAPRGWLWLETPFDVPETKEQVDRRAGATKFPCPFHAQRFTYMRAQEGADGGIEKAEVWFDHRCDFERFKDWAVDHLDAFVRDEGIGDDRLFADAVKARRHEVFVHGDDEENGPLGSYTSRVRALGWKVTQSGDVLVDVDGNRSAAPTGAVQILFFQDFTDLAEPFRQGFGCWSYFLLRDGDRLGERIATFEEKAKRESPSNSYAGTPGRGAHPLHEFRWLYAALHLMAQKLATTVRHETDRATRRNAERTKQVAPPFLTVVTLRRLDADRRREAPTENDVDWQWRWSVVGHWRKQPTNEGVRDVYIESYVKGPPDKPMKPGSIKLFAARR